MFASPLVPVAPVSNPTFGVAPDSSAGDERELIDGLLADDERAWRSFNTRYGRLIFRCITRVTSRFSAVVAPDDVREIYATLCLSLLANDKRKLRSFEPERGSKLGSWLGMLAIHAAYDFLRTTKREPKRATLTEAEGLSSELPNPHEACVQRQRLGLVESLLADFSDKDREFVALYYGEGLAPEAIAEQMGISVKTVYSKKHKIRARLETLLTERNLTA